jgi:hypothetical protein
MFFIDLWGFSIDPLYLVYSSTKQELLFCVFLSFRTFQNSNGARIFLELISFPDKEHEKKNHTRGPTRPRQAQVAHALAQVMPPCLVCTLGL